MASAQISEQGRILYVWTGDEWVPVSGGGGGGVPTFYQTASPTFPELGTIWIDEDGGFDGINSKPAYIWDGSNWISFGDGGGISENAADLKYLPLAGGEISGDLEILGNLIVSGSTVFLNTSELTIEDNIITLNSNVSGSPTLNAGIEINRGSENTVAIIWNETTKKWQFTTDGIEYKDLGSSSVLYQSEPPDAVALGLDIGAIWVDSDADLAEDLGTNHIHPQYLSLITASNTYLKQVDASNIYLDLSTASATYATKTDLENIDLTPYLTLSQASATYLTIEEFNDVDFLPDQEGNEGKYLFTNGASASWQSVEPVPAGGTKEELLAKNSSTDYDADWVDINKIIVNPLLLMGA